MRPLCLLAGLALAGPAHAARHELSFEYLGALHHDPQLTAVFDADDDHGFGLRGGAAVLRDRHRLGLVIDAGWVRAQHGATIAVPDGSLTSVIASHWDAHTFTLGAKADVDVAGLFFPYLHVQAGLIAGAVRLDDDTSTERNPNQLRANGLAPAGLFTGGFELMVPDRRLGLPVTAAVFFEAGYQAAGAMRLDGLGDPVDLSGPLVRAGVGLRM